MMPGKHGFTSKAQQGKIFAMQSRGELKPGVASRMANETPSFKKLPAYAARGGRVGSDELRDRHPEDEYGGAVKLAYGGFTSGDEMEDRHPDEEYGGEVYMSAGGEALTHCPHCGMGLSHGGNVGRHMQPGFQDMDPEQADQEADLHLGKALMKKNHLYTRGK